MGKTQEIGEELKSVLSGKTIDALLPPLVFVLVNAIFSLEVAVIAALALALSLAVLRILRKQSWYYALGGFLGVGLAAGLALLTQNASSYFLPAIIGSALLSLAALVSIFIGKPLAAWLSHLTRGWPLDWFWRSDVKPAYTRGDLDVGTVDRSQAGDPDRPLPTRGCHDPGMGKLRFGLAGDNRSFGAELCLWHLALAKAGRTRGA
jgi:hypothetical protein